MKLYNIRIKSEIVSSPTSRACDQLHSVDISSQCKLRCRRFVLAHKSDFTQCKMLSRKTCSILLLDEILNICNKSSSVLL